MDQTSLGGGSSSEEEKGGEVKSICSFREIGSKNGVGKCGVGRRWNIQFAMLKDRSGSVLGGEHEIGGLKLESSLLGIKV